jgi:hypothetical protein
MRCPPQGMALRLEFLRYLVHKFGFQPCLATKIGARTLILKLDQWHGPMPPVKLLYKFRGFGPAGNVQPQGMALRHSPKRADAL